MEVRGTGCCAVLELVDISHKPDAAAVIKEAIGEIKNQTFSWGRKKPFITFTGVVGDRYTADHASSRNDDYGQALADYIVEHGLGEVVNTIPARANWTHNKIKMWVWMPDYEALRALEKQLYPVKPKVNPGAGVYGTGTYVVTNTV